MSNRPLVSVTSMLLIVVSCGFNTWQRLKQSNPAAADVVGDIDLAKVTDEQRTKMLYEEIIAANMQILFVEYDDCSAKKRFAVNGRLGTGPETLEEIDRWLRLKGQSGPFVFVIYRSNKSSGFNTREDEPVLEKIGSFRWEYPCVSIATSTASAFEPIAWVLDNRTEPPFSPSPGNYGVNFRSIVTNLAAKYWVDRTH